MTSCETKLKNNLPKRNSFILILVLLTAGAVFLLAEKLKSPDYEVIITNEGFEPAILNIDKGTRVKFINLGRNQHWPASNFHPTHTLYPEEGGCLGSKLDACRGLAPGESYIFKFDIAGDWSMHDHLFPGLTMIVKVGHSHEYSQELETIKDLSKQDPARAWQYLKENFLINGEAAGNAHGFAHIIGNALYESRGIAGAQVCDPSFSFGCFHGVTEKMLTDKGYPALPEIQDKCAQIFAGEFQKFASCIHGTGHGLVSWENLNIKAALRDCEALAEANQSYCFDGVFMEYTTSSPEKNLTWEFCSLQAEKYQKSCGRYIVFFFKNPSASCSRAPDQALREVCSESVGFMAAQRSLGNFDKIKTECRTLPETQDQNSCLISSVREVIFQAYPEWSQTSEKICHELNSGWTEQCLLTRNETVKNYRQ